MQPLLAAADIVAQRLSMCGHAASLRAMLCVTRRCSPSLPLVPHPARTVVSLTSPYITLHYGFPHADDEGEFEVVEEMGFHTEVGWMAPRAEDQVSVLVEPLPTSPSHLNPFQPLLPTRYRARTPTSSTPLAIACRCLDFPLTLPHALHVHTPCPARRAVLLQRIKGHFVTPSAHRIPPVTGIHSWKLRWVESAAVTDCVRSPCARGSGLQALPVRLPESASEGSRERR